MQNKRQKRRTRGLPLLERFISANIITNIEDVIERAEKENVPVITRKIMKNYFKKVDKNNQLKQKMLVAKILSKNYKN